MSDALSALLPFKRVCNCRGISRANVLAAVSKKGPFKDHAELHAAALEERRHDCIDGIGLPMTGAETGDGYNCSSQACRPDFESVVHYLHETARQKVIPIVSDDAQSTPPKIGSCGNDCNTCTPQAVIGCTPTAF